VELERVAFFSDAVIAIAITLLVVELSIPAATEDVGAALLDRWPQILSFILSFLVIGIFWRAHHRIFRYIAGVDELLITINLLFLMCVAFLPFPTAVLGNHDSSRASVVFYAASIGATGAVLAATWQYVVHAGLLNDRADPRVVRYITRRSLVTPLCFLGSIPFAFINPRLATFLWFVPLGLLAVINLRHQRS